MAVTAVLLPLWRCTLVLLAFCFSFLSGLLANKCAHTRRLCDRPKVGSAFLIACGLAGLAGQVLVTQTGTALLCVAVTFFGASLGSRLCVYGITGGIASGKSTLSRCLANVLGFTVIDADVIARQILQPGRAAYKKVLAVFGPSILVPGKTEINRTALREAAFKNEEARRTLNRITHRYIIYEILRQIFLYRVVYMRSRVALDAALLMETNLDWMCAPVFVLATSPETQIERLTKRDGQKCSKQALEAMTRAQLPLTEKCQRADVIFDNNGTIDGLQSKVTAYFRERV